MEARRSIFARLVLGAIGLSAALSSLWFVTHQTVLTTLEDSAAKEVDVDIAGLVDIYATSGLTELSERINDRIALTPSEGNTPHYLLATDAGEALAGDIAQSRPLVGAVGHGAVLENHVLGNGKPGGMASHGR